MSASYKHKIEVRQARDIERKALVAAKELFSRYSSCDRKKEMPALQSIRDVIIKTRRDDINKDKPGEQTDLWYKSLANQLLSGLFKKTKIYLRILNRRTDLIFI
jgi:hypothetical protein